MRGWPRHTPALQAREGPVPVVAYAEEVAEVPANVRQFLCTGRSRPAEETAVDTRQHAGSAQHAHDQALHCQKSSPTGSRGND